MGTIEILNQLLKICKSQKEFCEKTGIPEPRVSEWLKGKREPRLSNLEKAAEKLGYEISLKIKKC